MTPLTQEDVEVNKHWFFVLGDLTRKLLTNIFLWVFTAAIVGWFGHSLTIGGSAGARALLHDDIQKVADQVLVLNVKVEALIETEPDGRQQKAQQLIKDRLAVLALAGKPIQP